jgi:hypothetical protein
MIRRVFLLAFARSNGLARDALAKQLFPRWRASWVLRTISIVGLSAGIATAAAEPVDVVEYYHAALDHYFISAAPAEIAALDAGVLAGWARTGASFKAYATPAAGANPVCRFYIPPGYGDSHFYSASPSECAQVSEKFPQFVRESSAVMYVRLPDTTTGACAAGSVPVYRVWNGRSDSNHRYTTDIGVRERMVASGWVAEGYGPDAVIMCGVDLGKGRLVMRAYKQDGTPATIAEFSEMSVYRNGNATGYGNYGVYPLGKLPGTPQAGSDLQLVHQGGDEYVAFDVPAQQPLYFTALWQAPTIGNVFMRADGEGAGIVVQAGQSQQIEIPYHFALSEFAQVQRLLPAEPLPAELQSLLAQAGAAVESARAASTPQARAHASYAALALAMPLKERIVVETANRSIAARGRRTDFDLNYEGFGSWTVEAFAPGYVAAKAAGFKSVYTIVDWKIVSPTRGTYDFSYLDYQIDQARAQGFGVALQVNWGLGSLPEWAWDLEFEELKALYYEQARMVVERYGTKVSTYYACGEMELNTRGLPMEQAAELARQSLAGARAASPGTPFGIYVSASAYVSYQMNVVPSPTYFSGTDLLAYLRSRAIDFDFVALQMQYGTVFAPIDVQRFQEVMRQTYDIVKVPIILGETGSSSKSEDYGIPAQSAWHGDFTQQTQYEWADATLRALYALPFVKGYYWVHVDPDDYGADIPFLSLIMSTGLVRADGSVKKVFDAFKNFTAWVDGLPAP